ncbi:hypothetical protein BSL78_12208 [Apostichopus japonicus]|uniref:LRAT domain-containing protein n=1 Tax=Stichopus japonicus TaxID=307972 RepID=A0A2G8KSD3_STIJA|nr:hypothetical protein BSL78_12208 [Apostichopus japonicus]
MKQHTKWTGCGGSICSYEVTDNSSAEDPPLTKYYCCRECRKEWLERRGPCQPHHLYFSPQLCCLIPSDTGTLANCCWEKVQGNEPATILKAGDHVAWVRGCGYWHHGIVEKKAKNKLHLIEFSKRSCCSWKIKTSEQSISSICSPVYKAYYTEELLDQNPPDLVIVRALSRRDETGYNLLTNNCEHFATFCKTGVYRSDQIYQTQIGFQSLILKSLILLIRLIFFVAITEGIEAAHEDSEQQNNSEQVNDLSSTQVFDLHSINKFDYIGAILYILLEIIYLFIALGITWCIDIPQLYNLQMGWPPLCCRRCRNVKSTIACGKATTRMVLHTVCVIVGVVSCSVLLKALIEGKKGPWTNGVDIFIEIGLGVAGGFFGSILGFLLFTLCPSVHCCFQHCKCYCCASLACCTRELPDI